MIIRPLMISDAVAASDILFQSWQKTFSRYLPKEIVQRFTPEQCLETWTRLLAQPSAAHMHSGAFSSDRLLGTISVGPSRFRTSEWREIWAMHVSPEAQGHGVGTKLLEQTFHDERLKGHSQLHLLCLEANAGALRFYSRNKGVLGDVMEKRGFREREIIWSAEMHS